MFTIKDLRLSLDSKEIIFIPELEIVAGNHLLLLGPSGCGKTSLMNLMAGLLRPTSGEIRFKDQPYSTLSDSGIDALRSKNFGFVFQRLHLIGHLTAAQNIALAQPQKDEGRIAALIHDLWLEGKESRKARDLSVGEAQRVALARAVANNPSVIFADEPTSALDDKNASGAMDMLFSQAQKTGATLIVATHDARIKPRFSNVMEITA
jgi:putative ABC transport system ATP-binding protein